MNGGRQRRSTGILPVILPAYNGHPARFCPLLFIPWHGRLARDFHFRLKDNRRMAYFLKLVGLSNDPLPPRWWEYRPELMNSIFFSDQFNSSPMNTGDILIYYAVRSGRLCGIA